MHLQEGAVAFQKNAFCGRIEVGAHFPALDFGEFKITGQTFERLTRPLFRRGSRRGADHLLQRRRGGGGAFSDKIPHGPAGGKNPAQRQRE